MALLLLGGPFLLNSLANEKITINNQWLRLLHYDKDLVSRAEGKNFFVVPEGKKDPQLELESFVESFKNAPSDDHPICRYPARVLWLKKYYPQIKIPNMECTKFEKYKKRIAAKSAALVFSSYYLANPGSSFGHTFLRLGKFNDLGNDDDVSLLDTGVSYGAVADHADPLSYVVGGLGGWYWGSLTAIPYYYKVREYNDFEMRDLWNYHLKLNQDQIDMLVAHSWELEEAHFKYYFLSENCSMVILRMIEAVMPEIELESMLPFYIIPSDTLKVVLKKNLVSKVTYRPSAWADFNWHYQQLSNKEKKEFKKIIKNSDHPLNETNDAKVRLLDTAIRYTDFKYAKELLKDEPLALNIKRPYLIQRSKIAIQSEIPLYHLEKSRAPHVGHASRRLSIGSNLSKGQVLPTFEFRFAFHDILDQGGGYPKYSTMEVMKISLASLSSNNLSLRSLTLFKAASFRPVSSYQTPLSWSLAIGFDRFQAKQAYNWKAAGVDSSVGWTLGPENNLYSLSVLGNLNTLYSWENSKKFILAYGPQWMALLNLTDGLKFMLKGTYHLHPWVDQSYQSTLRYSNEQWGIDISHESHSGDFKNLFGTKAHFYF